MSSKFTVQKTGSNLTITPEVLRVLNTFPIDKRNWIIKKMENGYIFQYALQEYEKNFEGKYGYGKKSKQTKSLNLYKEKGKKDMMGEIKLLTAHYAETLNEITQTIYFLQRLKHKTNDFREQDEITQYEHKLLSVQDKLKNKIYEIVKIGNTMEKTGLVGGVSWSDIKDGLIKYGLPSIGGLTIGYLLNTLKSMYDEQRGGNTTIFSPRVTKIGGLKWLDVKKYAKKAWDYTKTGLKYAVPVATAITGAYLGKKLSDQQAKDRLARQEAYDEIHRPIQMDDDFYQSVGAPREISDEEFYGRGISWDDVKNVGKKAWDYTKTGLKYGIPIATAIATTGALATLAEKPTTQRDFDNVMKKYEPKKDYTPSHQRMIHPYKETEDNPYFTEAVEEHKLYDKFSKMSTEELEKIAYPYGKPKPPQQKSLDPHDFPIWDKRKYDLNYYRNI